MESLDYLKLCCCYYSSCEEGTCMENCEYYNHDECPVVYVNGLLSEREDKIAVLEKALELACEDINSLYRKNELKAQTKLVLTMQPFGFMNLKEHFKKQAKEMMKSEQ